jgi:GntR family transcriptional regulator, galactonate operon transcriptional repressor
VTRLHQSAMDRILDRVAHGEIRPGDWLPREQRMEAELGISRGVARETVQALKERGVVDVRHGRGQWIRPEEDWNVLDQHVLAALIDARRFDLLREVVECRALLAPSVAALAAKRKTRETLDRLVAAHARLENAAGARRRATPHDDPFVGAEIEFHRALARMAGNRVVGRILEPVDEGIAIVHHELAADPRDAIVRLLGRVRAAVEAGNADRARAAMESSVGQTRRWLTQAQSAAA